MKGWKDRFFFIDRRAIPDAMTWRHHDFDVYDAFPDNDFSVQDVRTLTERVIDLHTVPSRILFGVGLATTWEFPGFFPIFKDTEVITMSEYLRFPFLSGTEIMQGAPVPPNHPDPKVIAAREKKKAQVARVVAKKKENKKRSHDAEGSFKAKKKKKKSASASSDRISSPVPLEMVALVNQVILVHNRDEGRKEDILDDGNRSPSPSPRGSRPIHPAKEHVFLSKTNVDESSHPLNNLSIEGPVSQPREILTESLVYYSPGVMAQADMLERFENLTADYDALAETHADSLKEEHAGCEQRIQILEKPFNMAIQAEWGEGLSEGLKDEEIMDVLRKDEGFNPYSDKKLYPLYDKLFKKEYPYVEKIANGYHHSVANLMKVHPNPTPSKDTSTPTVSKTLSGSGPPPLQKT
ncbi:hypothetical protein Tco_0138055 [Tanacetum coccineum]